MLVTEEITSSEVSSGVITIEFEEGFKTEYNVGEQLNTNGLKVYLLYDDGSRKELEAKSYKITASPSFGKAAGYARPSRNRKNTYGISTSFIRRNGGNPWRQQELFEP